MQTHEFLSAARIDPGILMAWIEAGWLAPRCRSGKFLDMDLARSQFIRDLEEMGVNDEGIPVILDLVDQLHGLRRALGEVLSAVRAQAQSRHARM